MTWDETVGVGNCERNSFCDEGAVYGQSDDPVSQPRSERERLSFGRQGWL